LGAGRGGIVGLLFAFWGNGLLTHRNRHCIWLAAGRTGVANRADSGAQKGRRLARIPTFTLRGRVSCRASLNLGSPSTKASADRDWALWSPRVGGRARSRSGVGHCLGALDEPLSLRNYTKRSGHVRCGNRVCGRSSTCRVRSTCLARRKGRSNGGSPFRVKFKEGRHPSSPGR
jgi:hypothetical protein